MLPQLVPLPSARALIFDCDGTLAITRHAHFSVLQEAFSEQGLAFDESWYLSKAGLSLNETCHAYSLEYGLPCDAAAIRQVHTATFPRRGTLIRPVEAVVAVAQAHFGRRPMSVASGGDQGIVEMTLRQIGVHDLFDHVVAIGAITRGKPEPDLFLEAARRLGCTPGECFVYEDSDEGMLAAMRAGMQAVDVRHVIGVER